MQSPSMPHLNLSARLKEEEEEYGTLDKGNLDFLSPNPHSPQIFTGEDVVLGVIHNTHADVSLGLL